MFHHAAAVVTTKLITATTPPVTPTVPSQQTVTLAPPGQGQVQQWNPAPQIPQVQQMPSLQGSGGGVSVAGIFQWVIGVLLVVFVIAGIVALLMTVFGKDRSDVKKAAKTLAVVSIGAAGIALLVGGALMIIMNGVVQSITRGIGG